MNMALIEPLQLSRPKARSRTETRDDGDAEYMLANWGEWCSYKRQAQGFGGGVDMENGRLPRAPGTHGDPVLAEILATEGDDQGRDQLVDSILKRYTRDWQKVAWARWVGCIEPTGWHKGRQVAEVQIADGMSFPYRVSYQMVTTWKWSGPQAFMEVARQTGISLRTCERIAAQIKRLLVLDIAAAEHRPRP